MSFEADLKTHLQADSTLMGLVGERIYPVIAPQGVTRPYVVYQRISGIPQTDLDGLDGGLLEIRVQLDAYAATFDSMATLAEALRTRLQTSAATFHAITTADRDLFEEAPRLYRRSLDCTFWYHTS